MTDSRSKVPTAPQASDLPARTWPDYLNTVVALADEARRVIKLGGLSSPGVAESLLASRVARAATAPAASLLNLAPRPGEA